MKRNLTAKETITITSMLFGMFFGAGNLIFPVSMGQQAGSQVWITTLGFLITGVGLPLLGVVLEDPNMTLAASFGKPLLRYAKRCDAAKAFRRIARRVQGFPEPMKLR